ncbi:MAG: hypothetical protein IJT77_01445 [Clostridia bacterium]|nr:hypothetical protein [Clostridia bacterium]
MTIIKEQELRFSLRYEIVKELPGYLRIRFPAYRSLPEEAVGYLGYLNDAMTLMPGILSATPNPRIGSLLIRYQPDRLDTKKVRRWIQAIIDEGIAFFREYEQKMPDEPTIEKLMRKRLADRMVRVILE